MTRHAVAPVDDLGPGDREIIDADGTSIGVFNIDGEYYALLNRCLHDAGPVCTGRVKGRLVGEFTGIGERIEESFDADDPTIACPWHGWEYRLKTGEHIADEDIVLPTYEVVVDDDTVYVEV